MSEWYKRTDYSYSLPSGSGAQTGPGSSSTLADFIAQAFATNHAKYVNVGIFGVTRGSPSTFRLFWWDAAGEKWIPETSTFQAGVTASTPDSAVNTNHNEQRRTQGYPYGVLICETKGALTDTITGVVSLADDVE